MSEEEIKTGITRLIHYYRPQRSWGKVMFLQASVILLTGGEYLTRYTPPDQVHPPWTRYTPPGTRYTPRNRYTPLQTRYTPLGPGTPPGTRYKPPRPPQDHVHTPPGPGTPPWDKVHPPGTRYTPQDQIHPPGPGRYGLRAGGMHPTGMHSCFTHGFV